MIDWDLILWSDTHWDAAGLKRFRGFLIIVFPGIIGGALCWFHARPRLEKVNIRY